MNYFEKEYLKLIHSINNFDFTIYSGIYAMNKINIVDSFIKNIEYKYNCIKLDFSIKNINRMYKFEDCIKVIKNSIVSSGNNLVILYEVTNIDSWIEIINEILSNLKIKILAISSIDVSASLTFTKKKNFRFIYNSIQYNPPTFNDYFSNNNSLTIDNYIEFGSIIMNENVPYSKQYLRSISELNYLRLMNILFVLTKVKDHFHFEIFVLFLLNNIDKKLTLDFIKTNIDSLIKNIKTFWKYINLLQALYILIPIKTYSWNENNTKFNSRYVCVDHVLFSQLSSNKKYFFIFRNIIINEFIKRNLLVLFLEENGNEIGFFGKLESGQIILICYNQHSITIDKFKKRKNVYQDNIFIVDKELTYEDMIEKIKKINSRFDS